MSHSQDDTDIDTADRKTREEGIRKVAELASDMRISMLTTIGDDGELVSRPMAQQDVEFDGDLWFFSEQDSRTTAHVRRDPHVGLTMSSSDSWLSIDGTAEIVVDVAKQKQLWNAWVEAWMPQGPEDPSVVLVKVTGHTAQYWDTPGGRIASVISLVKSKITGDRYEGVEEGVVDLDR